MLDSLPSAPAKADASTTEEQAASFERIAAGRVFARADGSPFAAQRQRALGGFAVCLASRLDDGRTPASRGQFAFARLACDERPEIRGQRRIHRRWRQGGDRRATGRRTRLSLWPLHVRGRDREPHARGQHAVRARRRLRRQPYAASRSQRRKRPCRRLFAGRGHAGETLGRTPFRRLQTRRPRRRSPLARARPQQIARASREQPRTKPRAADKSPTARRLRLPPGSRPPAAAHAPAESSGKTADGRPPDPVASVGAVSGANRPVRRTAVGALRRRGVVPTRRLDGQRRTRGRRAARERARRWLRALDVRRSARSTSIFRREASRMSR